MSDDLFDEFLSIVSSDDRWLRFVAATQAEEGDWSALEMLLATGADQPRGLHLTRAECRILCEILSGKRKRRPAKRGRAPDKKAESRAVLMAAYSLLLEMDGVLTKVAVATAAEICGVKRATVYAARKQYSPLLRTIEENFPTSVRQNMRKRLEAEAPRFQFRP